MDGYRSEYVENYTYYYANESDHSHNNTHFEQFLVFYSYRNIIAIYVAAPLASIGIVGNIVSFFFFGKLARKNSVTFALRVLAVNDTFILLCITPVLYAGYTGEVISFRNKPCPITTAVALEAYIRVYMHPLINIGVIVGTWTSVVIGMTRYIVVCRPLQAAILCTVNRARKQKCCAL